MSRNKYPELTIQRILDSAAKLFMEKGYEKTTIQDIVDELGDLSKGAIYHHFKSKEEIIDAVSEQEFTKNNWLEKVRENHELSGLEKIRKAFALSLTESSHQKMVAGSFSLMKNPKYIVEHLKSTLVQIAPYLEPLIQEGIEDGSLSTTDAKSASEVIMLLTNLWISPIVLSKELSEIKRRIQFLKITLEQMGIPILSEDVVAAAVEYCDHAFMEAETAAQG